MNQLDLFFHRKDQHKNPFNVLDLLLYRKSIVLLFPDELITLLIAGILKENSHLIMVYLISLTVMLISNS